jgi:cyclopropane-fatty-acyl-phospholipid synthase
VVTTPTRTERATPPTGLAALLTDLLGGDLPVRIECYDGTAVGPTEGATRVVVRSADALRYILTAPGELGFARAYVAGALDVEGDIFDALRLRDSLPDVRLHASQWLALARLAGTTGLRRPPIPPEEARLHGRRHSRARDRAAVSYHYDVSNDFYRMILGPSMTYSCAVWSSPDITLEDAQAAKYDLVCRKLGLRPGMRLLDIGCGWGGMVMHAARNYGVEAVGVTLSERQAEYGTRAIAEAGLLAVEVRIQDYRDIPGRFDAISSIGMFEHVGVARLAEYFTRCHDLLEPGGRFLNHGISRRAEARTRARFNRRGFIDRYVFPDGELHEVGSVASRIQQAGFEVRHLESLREHYGLTLRAWVRNLEANWDDAVAAAGSARARVWRLYMAGSALNFEAGSTQVHQVLAVRSADGRSGMPLRPDW